MPPFKFFPITILKKDISILLKKHLKSEIKDFYKEDEEDLNKLFLT